MKRLYTRSLLGAALLGAGAIAYAVAAAESGNDALAIQQAKIPLTQAIAIAEQHANGKASRAEFEHSKRSGWLYEVEVVSGSKVFDVKVDANQGTVIAATEDRPDHGDGHDDQD